MNSPKIFAGSSNLLLAQKISDKSKIPLGKIDLGVFSDGEVDVWIQDDVNNCDVFILQSNSAPVNRHIIELALIVFLILLFPKLNNPSQDKKFATLYTLHPTPLLKNPIFLSLLVFFSSMTISAIFAVNPYRAFWGDLERGEGFFGIIHYFLFLKYSIIASVFLFIVSSKS